MKEKIGVLISNLGTPDAPTSKAVRKFLAEFLWDPRVIEVSRPLWWLILHGIILRLRPSRVKKIYAQVWTDEGSPLLSISQKLVDKLQQQLGDRYHCVLGMRYGNPSLKSALLQLRKAGVSKVIILPLYPQNSGTTTGSTFDEVTRLFKKCRGVPHFEFINEYHAHPAYIQAIADSIQNHWQNNGRAEKLLMTFHGLPQSYVDKGDPYYDHCLKTAELVANALSLNKNAYAVSFQSRVGKAQWLTPYTDHLLKEWGQSGVESVQAICPGFPIDCIETIEEIGIENCHYFLEAGGKRFEYIPALNDSDAHLKVLSEIILT